MPRSFRYSRPKSAPSESLVAYLSLKFSYFTSLEWEREVSAGHLSVNGVLVTDAEHELRQQDLIQYAPPPAREPAADVTHLDFLMEDDAILVCCKNGHLPVTEGGRYCENTLTSFLNRHPHGMCPSFSSLESTNTTALSSSPKRSRQEPACETREEPALRTDVQYFPIHRIDKETSGVLVFAKSIEAAQILSATFETQSVHLATQIESHLAERKKQLHSLSSSSGLELLSHQDFDLLSLSNKAVKKSYVAVLAGTAKCGEVHMVVTHIGAVAQDPAMKTAPEHRKLPKLKMLCYPFEDLVTDREAEPMRRSLGKVAVSRITILSSDASHGVSVVRVEILTGRTHQIRLHCAHIGFPILGDKLYTTHTPGQYGGAYPVSDDVYLERVRSEEPFLQGGTATSFRCRRHLLHAAELNFPHPSERRKVIRCVASPASWLLLDVTSDNVEGLNALHSMVKNVTKTIFFSS